MTYRFRTLLDGLVSGYLIAVGWLAVVMAWLLVPLFMLAILALSIEAAKSRPLWAAGTLVTGIGIGMVVLYVLTRAFLSARREYRGTAANKTDDTTE